MNLLIALLFVTTAKAEAPTIPEPPPIQRPLTVQEKIIQEATLVHYSPTRALAIAKAESGFNPKAHNSNSSAKGIYQFINSTWRENCQGDVLNEDDNIHCALKLLSTGGESNWSESRFAWGNIK